MSTRDGSYAAPTEEVLPVIDVRDTSASGDSALLVADLKAQTFYYAEGHTVDKVLVKQGSRSGQYTALVFDYENAGNTPERQAAWQAILDWSDVWRVEILWTPGRITRRRRRR